MTKYKVGTRASQLAMTQTKQAVAALSAANPEVDFEIVPMTTKGDANQKDSLHSFGGVGVFVKELEQALLKGEIDVAVHSLKDVPNDVPGGLELACFPDREDPSDVLLLSQKLAGSLNTETEILSGEKIKIGTGSPRRVLQLQQAFPQAEFLPIRGNIDTRKQKLIDGEYEAIVLAAAGMNRLGLEHDHKLALPYSVCLPAVGQGCLAFEIRRGETGLRSALRKINDQAAEIAVLSERRFMAVMEGSCQLPLGAYAEVSKDAIELRVVCGNVEQAEMVKTAGSANLPDSPEAALAAGLELAGQMAATVKSTMAARGILIQA